MEPKTTALYFDEDEVVMRTGNTVKCGTVVESYADMFSEDENSSDDDGDLLKPGKVRVAFYPTGQETLVDECKVSRKCRSQRQTVCTLLRRLSNSLKFELHTSKS